MRELRDYQVRGLEALRQTIRQGVKRIAVQLPTGGGKCLGLGTLVLKFDGSIVPVECIKAGDELMGPDSAPRKVISTCTGYGPLFRIDPVKGASWVCNDVHVLTLVETVSGNVIDMPLDEYLLQTKWFKHLHKQFAPKDGVDFVTKEDPDLPAYFLGLWIGDGTKALHTVQISKPDIEVRDECECIAVANGGYVKTSIATNGGCPTYNISTPRGQPNRLLTRMRAAMGNGDIPLSVLTASRAYRAQVLAGVIDTDGYINRSHCEIVQRSVKLADGITFLARSLGFKVTCRDKVVNGVIYKRMQLGGDFGNIPTRIARKTAAPRRQKKCVTRTGFAVCSIGEGKYAGFELSGDGRFLLGDFTVTHNTLCAASIASGAQRKGNKLAFVVPRIALIDQTVEEFYKEEIRDIGVVQAAHPLTNWSKPIQVCSIDTIRARGVFPEASVVVFDEVHLFYEAHKRWMAERPETIFIGLSATPWTTGLGQHFDTLLVLATTKELIAQGWLSPFRVFATGHPDLSNVKIIAGEYHEGEASAAMQEGSLVADVVQTWKQRWGKDKTLCFAVDCAHAQAIQKRFIEAGIAAGYQDANTPPDERREIKRKFHNGEHPVVVSVGTLILGVDWEVRCISYCCPTRSEMKFVQAIGRALRTAPGKDHALILDHSDTTLRLGFVSDIHHEQLSMGKKDTTEEKPKVPLPKECKSCGFLKPPRVSLCPNCGFKAEIVSGVTERDGELVEIIPGNGAHKKADKKKTWTMEEKLAFFAQLKAYADERGYKPGWAAMKHKDKFGTFPNDWRFKEVAPAPPTAGMLSWIKSRQIAWAKSRKRTEDKPNGSAIAERDQRILDKVREQFIPGTLMTEKDLEDFR